MGFYEENLGFLVRYVLIGCKKLKKKMKIKMMEVEDQLTFVDPKYGPPRKPN